MATIRERNGVYQITVSLGRDYKDKQIREYTNYTPEATTPKAIEKEVQEFAKDFERRVLNGDYISGDKITFAEFVEIWRKNWLERSDLTQRIREEYLSKLENKVLSEIGHMKMAKIKAVHIDNILHEMTDNGKAPKTVRQYFTVINSVFRYAFKKQIIKENPCLRCDDLPTIKRDNELHYFTLEQAKRFISALDKEYTSEVPERKRTDKDGNEYIVKAYSYTHTIPLMYKAYFMISIYGGFRRGEVCALTWNDIDFNKCSISITKAVSKTKSNGQIVKEPKTVSSEREIRLPEECFKVLKDWKTEQTQLSFKLGSAWRGHRGKDFDSNSVFIKLEDGTRIDVDTPSHKFKEILKMYNETVPEEERLPEIRLHDLRHTSATLLLAYGSDIETVSHRLGHSKASTTLDIYGHALETMDEKASEVLGQLFG